VLDGDAWRASVELQLDRRTDPIDFDALDIAGGPRLVGVSIAVGSKVASSRVKTKAMPHRP
jgi:hypothetical protein